MKLSCKAISISTAVVVFTIILAVLVIMAYLAYPGGQMTLSPLDMRILRGGMSSLWCEGQTLRSRDKIAFNASLLPGEPQIDPNKRRKITIKENEIGLTPDKNRVFWRYYLTKGSIFDATQCSKTSGVMSYLFKGHDVDESCIRYVLTNDFEWPKGHNPCTDITIQRFIVRVCRNAMQPMHAVIVDDDFYLLLYQSSYPDFTFISVNVTLNSPTYDLSNSLANCSSNDECVLPVRFGRSDTVVANLLDPTGNDATLEWSCVLRWTFYCIIFIGVPVTVFAVCCVTCKSCYYRRAKKDANKPCRNAEPIAEPREVGTEKEPLLRYSPELPRIDPRLRDMGPIPGPSASLVPTAPPILSTEASPQPFHDPFQPSGYGEPAPSYGEPPPSYDETMREDENETRIAEKC